MFSELIYTRCRQGIDILNGGRKISSDGYKVYSCTSALLNDDRANLQFLLNAAQTKHSYSDPLFMDDAYLYFVPDKGNSFMVDFHPIAFDNNVTGDFAHRPGNYINQVLTGDFSGFYPHELFRDTSIWNAKARGEAYYYANPPEDLPARTDISDPAGQLGIEEIGAFISDGRKEALMKAVSFIINQFGLSPEERKYLVIRDETSENIEMWIAAIEYAFSPRMAAAIPFATRMDRFTTANRYTVNQSGAYQPQINLQDRNQKLRFRALVVGVDERDRTNAPSARASANSPFVVLDGKEKKAMFDTDVSNHYYQFITTFNEEHQSFCRDFLQMINIGAPSEEIHTLSDIYLTLANPSLPKAQDMAAIVAILGKYTLLNSGYLKKLYNRVTAGLPNFFQEDPCSALQIIKWLQLISRAVNDLNATNNFIDIVCDAFAEQVYRKSDPTGTMSFWQNIKDSEFANSVSGFFIKPTTLQANQTDLLRLEITDAITFVSVYLSCATLLGTVQERDIQSVVNWGMKKCYEQRDTDSVQKIIRSLTQVHYINAQDMLFLIAQTADSDYAGFLIQRLIENDESILFSYDSMAKFLEKLKDAGMERFSILIFRMRLQSLKRATDVEQLIQLVKTVPSLNNNELVEIFVTLDSKLVITDKGNIGAALALQREKPVAAICVKSAHIYALEILNHTQTRVKFTGIYSELTKQGFPTESSPDYINTLTDRLFKIQMTQNELEYIIQLFIGNHAYLSEFIRSIIGLTTSKRKNEWNTLITIAAKSRNRILNDTITEECSHLKQGERILSQLSDMLDSKESRNYFKQIAENVKEIIRSQKSKPGLARIFDHLFGGGDDKPRS